MKVLERKEWTHQCECAGCKSKLLVEAGDIRYGTFGGGYGGEVGDPAWYAECEVCGTTIMLHDTATYGGAKVFIPENIKSAARAAYVKDNGGR